MATQKRRRSRRVRSKRRSKRRSRSRHSTRRDRKRRGAKSGKHLPRGTFPGLDGRCGKGLIPYIYLRRSRNSYCFTKDEMEIINKYNDKFRRKQAYAVRAKKKRKSYS